MIGTLACFPACTVLEFKLSWEAFFNSWKETDETDVLIHLKVSKGCLSQNSVFDLQLLKNTKIQTMHWVFTCICIYNSCSMKEFMIISLCCIMKNKSLCACKVIVLFPLLFIVS